MCDTTCSVGCKPTCYVPSSCQSACPALCCPALGCQNPCGTPHVALLCQPACCVASPCQDICSVSNSCQDVCCVPLSCKAVLYVPMCYKRIVCVIPSCQSALPWSADPSPAASLPASEPMTCKTPAPCARSEAVGSLTSHEEAQTLLSSHLPDPTRPCCSKLTWSQPARLRDSPISVPQPLPGSSPWCPHWLVQVLRPPASQA